MSRIRNVVIATALVAGAFAMPQAAAQAFSKSCHADGVAWEMKAALTAAPDPVVAHITTRWDVCWGTGGHFTEANYRVSHSTTAWASAQLLEFQWQDPFRESSNQDHAHWAWFSSVHSCVGAWKFKICDTSATFGGRVQAASPAVTGQISQIPGTEWLHTYNVHCTNWACDPDGGRPRFYFVAQN
jgi:hypothetical protein